MKNKYYINPQEFTHEILISQAKGRLTEKAGEMLILLSDRLSRKFRYDDLDLKYDCKMQGLFNMIQNYKSFDGNKYESAFPYFSEIMKRGLAMGLKICTDQVRIKHNDISMTTMETINF